MVNPMAMANEHEVMTETVLWRAVVARAIEDWLSKPLRPKHEAERYLFTNSCDLSSVCHSAEIDVVDLRTRLNKVRGRILRDILPVAQ
jgi:hypothetical protein